MTTFGYVLILLSMIGIRYASRGVGLSKIGPDLSNLVIAMITGGDVTGALAVTGSSADYGATVAGAGASATAVPAGTGGGGNAILAEAKREAVGAGYSIGSSGPKMFDCSGLVWSAMVTCGYNVPRFSTRTFVAVCGGVVAQTTAPEVGDIVLWPGHIGIVDGPGSCFSALSPQSGIKSLSIASLTKSKGAAPTYWRLK